MIAGNISAWKDGKDYPERCEGILVELVDTNVDAKYVEIAFHHKKERVYIQFRLTDLLREIKEMTP